MTAEQLAKANAIKKEIDETESFIRVAEKVWTGKLIKRTSTLTIKTTPYGIYNEAEYPMSTEMKNKVLNVVREHLKELYQRLGSL